MNNSIFLIGGGIGCGVIGYIFGYRRGKEDTIQYADTLVESYRKEKEKSISDLKAEIRALAAGEEFVVVPSPPADDPRSHVTTTDYHRVTTKYEKPDIADIHKFRELQKAKPGHDEPEIPEAEDDVPDDPYLITMAEYLHEKPTYEKLDLYFYRFDEIICDASDSIIEDPEEVLGWDFYTVLEKEQLAYVRNEDMETDFEIHALSKTYREDYTDRLETDAERKTRRELRRSVAVGLRK